MDNKQIITVLGAGSWGTALSMVLADNGHEVRIWSHKQSQVDEINDLHVNSHYLPGKQLPKELTAFSDLKAALENTDAILFVIPTKAIRQVSADIVPFIHGKPVIIHASKGLEQGTHKRISEILIEEIPEEKRNGVVALSGPSHAEEVAVKDLTTITSACHQTESAEYVQNIFMNDYFRVYTNQDIVGVELGGALKNIIAVGAGALVGLGYGDNAKAALMTRGLAEITRLGVSFGADPLTFLGLSGVGDLIVTCTSIHSRNWRAGKMLGEGKSLDEIVENMGMIIEGLSTTKAAYELAVQKNVELPITTAIYEVLYNNADVKEVITELMNRVGKNEIK
ncbi:NAD(P)H-dependent glycerol-3-phosphate dehydrogenase [Desemzia incerta]|uniref:NAD(P)H-dependent glycerol-3-phosphate dehydrogenase n=1 Tax=Desemzia incerta TaxID=82801 RepID=UPI0024C39492|nr:NAD(P)H-dependent glycerol-3-phosphate dehydrogenase [Desemzia incerta]WHZ31079.1 NAD(P)H-dependent glycerol-3-phosphate dehydrogenase [Desemzia incerta]